MKELFDKTFGFKAEFLWPVDWRPREFNKPPDVLCNIAMNEAKSSCLEPNWDELVQKLHEGNCLQIHCDGGYREKDGTGAAAFVVHMVEPILGSLDRIAWEAQFLRSVSSSFHAECTAMEMAVNFAQLLTKRSAHSQVIKKRRVLFIA